VTVRAGVDQPCAARRATIQADQTGLGRGLVDEDQLSRVQTGLAPTPFDAGLGHVRAVLLRAMQGLFFRVSLR
jgi:hypothetical protein